MYHDMLTPKNHPGWLTTVPIAHRGLHSKSIPENSLRAFAAAINAGVAIEADVQHTKDNQVIIFHDLEIQTSKHRRKKIKNMTYAEVRKYFPDTPLLSDALELINGAVPLYLEVKNFGYPGKSEQKLVQIMNDYTGPYSYLSFNIYVLYYMRRHSPTTPIGLNLSSYKSGASQFSLSSRILSYAFAFHPLIEPDYFSFDIREKGIKRAKFLRRRGALVFVWTVKKISEAKAVQSYTNNIMFEHIPPVKVKKLI